jgi:hypothetical protein
VHAHAAPGERQRDAAGADTELERGPVPGECCEEKSTVGSTTSGSNMSALDSS